MESLLGPLGWERCRKCQGYGSDGPRTAISCKDFQTQLVPLTRIGFLDSGFQATCREAVPGLASWWLKTWMCGPACPGMYADAVERLRSAGALSWQSSRSHSRDESKNAVVLTELIHQAGFDRMDAPSSFRTSNENALLGTR